jgi:hypothetical protein
MLWKASKNSDDARTTDISRLNQRKIPTHNKTLKQKASQSLIRNSDGNGEEHGFFQ